MMVPIVEAGSIAMFDLDKGQLTGTRLFLKDRTISHPPLNALNFFQEPLHELLINSHLNDQTRP